MRLTKFTHACVRLEHPDGGVLVIDLGAWTEPEAASGADAVLITHWHADHADRQRLAALGVTVFGPDDAGTTVPVSPGDEFEAAGFRIRAAGGRHAVVYGDHPDLVNIGYVIEDTCYHPGDSFHVPDQARSIETLLVPVQGSWMKIADAVDFVSTVRPGRAVGIHEGQLNSRGRAAANDWLARILPRYRFLAPGEYLDS